MFYFVRVLAHGRVSGGGVMMFGEPVLRRASGGGGRQTVFRWECRCQDRPVLLATYNAHGRINIKVRDRYWHVLGQVQTICPRCGAEHVLDLRGPTPRL